MSDVKPTDRLVRISVWVGASAIALLAGATACIGTAAVGQTAPAPPVPEPFAPVSFDSPAGRIDSYCVAENVRMFAQGGKPISVVSVVDVRGGPFRCTT